MPSLERQVAPDPYLYLPSLPTFELSSSDIVDGQRAPTTQAHGSAGGLNISPELSWRGFPDQTRSFVVSCFDPDAPTGCGYWHWMVVDLPASVTSLSTGAGHSDSTLPGGYHIKSDMGSRAYGGCAPPKGDRPHRYMFVVHAVDVPTLGLDAQANATVAAFNLAFHAVARARITVTFDT